MELNESNYYSNEADREYCSNSQYHDFFGTVGRQGCERRALAKVRGEFNNEPNDAMLLGSFVDCMLLEPEKVEDFKKSHSEMFTNKGELYAKFKRGEVMVERAKQNEFFMSALDGDHQTILTGEIFGVPFKAKLDVYKKGERIVDLKTTANLDELKWAESIGKKVNFMEFNDYALQGAIYRELVRQNFGETLPFYIAAISSQEHPRLRVYHISDEDMDKALEDAKDNIMLLPKLKAGEIEADYCDKCDWCADNIQITGWVDWQYREDEETDGE